MTHQRVYKWNIFVGILQRARNATHTDGFTGGIYPSAFYKELEMPHSLMNLQTDIVRQHFIEKWKCHTHWWLYRRNESVGILLSAKKYLLDMPLSPTKYICRYISSGNCFFFLAFSVCKTISNIFFTDRVSDIMWYYQRFPSVI